MRGGSEERRQGEVIAIKGDRESKKRRLGGEREERRMEGNTYVDSKGRIKGDERKEIKMEIGRKRIGKEKVRNYRN